MTRRLWTMTIVIGFFVTVLALPVFAGGEAPDIVLSDNASAAYSFAANGTAEPWDMSKITLKISDMLPGMRAVTQINGKNYILTMGSNVILPSLEKRFGYRQ